LTATSSAGIKSRVLQYHVITAILIGNGLLS